MRVPLLDLSEQYRALAEPIRAQLDEVLASQSFILGPKVAAFEEAIRGYCGSPHAIGVSSGTDALLAILMALEIGPGDAVITSAYSFFATAGCIARVGATPVFIDIDPETYNISPAALERYLAESCRRGEDGFLREPQGNIVRAIVPVHLFGLCCEMDAIHRISERFQLDVIEDAAQAIGAEYPFGGTTTKAGAMGEVGYFSFYPSKNLGAAGDAGMVICRDDAFAQRLRVCRQHGMEPRYYHHFIGGNFRLDEMQAAILGVKLPFLDGWSAARRGVADFYREEFKRLGLNESAFASRGAVPGSRPDEPPHLPSICDPHSAAGCASRASDAQGNRHGHLLSARAARAKVLRLPRLCAGDFPETERAARETLALPMYPELSREAQRYVAESIAEFFDQGAAV